MKVLIGCEESQTECLAFRQLGIEAYSCDIEPCSGGHPEWHFQCDVRDVWHDNFDLIILHPPCTYLSNAGATSLKKNGVYDFSRIQKGLSAKTFFLQCLNAPAPMVAVENPSPNSYWQLPPCSQYIEPYMFGDPYKKRTLLWLRNLPLLMATDIVVPQFKWCSSDPHPNSAGIRNSSMPGLHRSAKMRSKSFPGIANAMALQWGKGIYFS